MNAIGKFLPGGNPMAYMHDPMGQYISSLGPFGKVAWKFLNLPTIPLAYGVTVAGAAMNDQPALIGQFELYGEPEE